MLSNLPILSLIGLASLQTVRSQFTTATVFPGDSGVISSLRGQIEGTGKDGTTYVVSGFVSFGDVGVESITATLVEDATHMSEVIAISTGSVTGKLVVDCNYDSQLEGSCIEIEHNVLPYATFDSTATVTGVVELDPVVLATAKSAARVSYSVPLLSAMPLLSLGLGLLLHA